jgi:hypothetical protein
MTVELHRRELFLRAFGRELWAHIGHTQRAGRDPSGVVLHLGPLEVIYSRQ